MSPRFDDSESTALRFLPAMVIIAALIVMAGLVSLHAGAIEPAHANLSHIG